MVDFMVCELSQLKILRMMSHVLPEAIEDSGAVSLNYWGEKNPKTNKKITI